jgi:hypothetical protein
MWWIELLALGGIALLWGATAAMVQAFEKIEAPRGGRS